ncbi:hypothetical protein CD798_08470 [Bacillaceae bacterium SAOS 7]|nr:hypothetical protein CD798_08470 [Bacillaceae bacterium SAOS 7]
MRPTVEIDREMLNSVINQLGTMEKKAPQVISAALNRAMTNVASNVSKEVRQQYNIKAGDIKDTLEKTRSTKSSLSAVVGSKGNLVPLDRFKVSPRKVSPKRKTPIKVGVKKNGMKPLGSAFVGDISGIKVIKRRNKKRLPIARLFGPSVPQMVGNEVIVEKINQEGQETFYRRLDHEINRILDRGSGS